MAAFKTKKENYERQLLLARLSVLRNSLDVISKMDYKKEGAVSGRNEIDYELISRMTKAQAKLALEMEQKLSNKKEVEDE